MNWNTYIYLNCNSVNLPIGGNNMIIQFGEQIYINDALMSALVNYMDSEIREEVHRLCAPCDNETFLEHYCELDRAFYILLRGEFGIEII